MAKKPQQQTEADSGLGKTFPSELHQTTDPHTSIPLKFITRNDHYNDAKIYPTHTQWTADGRWIVFRSDRITNEGMAVNEDDGRIVQITEGGYIGTLLVSRKNMLLYYLSPSNGIPADGDYSALAKEDIILYEVNLGLLFSGLENKVLHEINAYRSELMKIPGELIGGGELALDASEEKIYFKESREEADKHLPEEIQREENFGPRNMGRGPGGIGCIDLTAKTVKHVVSAPFQIGHIQTNPWIPGEIVFCWETGGKAPLRIWKTVDGSNNYSAVYNETDFEWVTHEMVITEKEVAFAIMGHRPINNTSTGNANTGNLSPGQEKSWGNCGTREKPTGFAILDMRSSAMRIIAQTEKGSGFWHVAGSADKKWAAADDFDRNIYLINRNNGKTEILSTGHKESAQDHPHPSFSPDGTKILIQSAMLSKDGKKMDLCVIDVPAT